MSRQRPDCEHLMKHATPEERYSYQRLLEWTFGYWDEVGGTWKTDWSVVNEQDTSMCALCDGIQARLDQETAN